MAPHAQTQGCFVCDGIKHGRIKWRKEFEIDDKKETDKVVI